MQSAVKQQGSYNISNFTIKRYIVFIVTSILLFIIPFIRIDGKHLFLLSFDKKELHLLFTSFSTQELYLMPFILIFLFLFIFFITTLAGRIWCGWLCPQTIFRVFYRDFLQTKLLGIRKNTANKQKEPKNSIKNFIGAVIWTLLSILIASNFIWYFVPPEDFLQYIQDPSEHMLLIGIVAVMALFLVFDVIFLQEKFCIYVCPYARVQSVMFDNDTVHVIYNEKRGGQIYDNSGNMISNKPKIGDCTGCDACVKICPTHIDIRKGMQLDCINCLECIDACSKTMAKFGKKTLVEWSSKNSVVTDEAIKFTRFRTVGYVVVLCIVLVGLILMSTTKENMLLNINRATELYSVGINENEVEVRNDYVFLFENTDNKGHKYYFSVDNPNIKIQRPKNPINLEKGHKIKVIVRLATTKKLTKDDAKDMIIPIVINAYAVDDEDKIKVKRDTVFIYPKSTTMQNLIDKKRR